MYCFVDLSFSGSSLFLHSFVNLVLGNLQSLICLCLFEIIFRASYCLSSIFITYTYVVSGFLLLASIFFFYVNRWLSCELPFGNEIQYACPNSCSLSYITGGLYIAFPRMASVLPDD